MRRTEADVGEVGQLEQRHDFGKGDQVHFVELARRNLDDEAVEKGVVPGNQRQNQDRKVVIGPKGEDLAVDLLFLGRNAPALDAENEFPEEGKGLFELEEVVHRVDDLGQLGLDLVSAPLSRPRGAR